MADKTFDLEGYVTVPERLAAFYELFAGGRIVTSEVEVLTAPDGVQRVMVKALAYRSVDDPLPGVGYSWMALPGTTSFTKGSELENSETSAWGRAIASLGILVAKGLATSQEIASKQDDSTVTGAASGQAAPVIPDEPWSEGPLEVSGAVFLNPSSGMDGEVRTSPDGPRLGFGLALDAQKKIPQVVAIGELAIDISDAIGNEGRHLEGMPVTVSGELLRVPWAKGGKKMPAFQRLILARIVTPDWTLPVPSEVAPGQEVLELA